MLENENLLDLDDDIVQNGAALIEEVEENEQTDEEERPTDVDLMQYFEELADARAPKPEQAEEVVEEKGYKARFVMQDNKGDETMPELQEELDALSEAPEVPKTPFDQFEIFTPVFHSPCASEKSDLYFRVSAGLQ